MDQATLTSRPTILIAEDDADIRDLLTDLLDDVGYRVVAAADGLAALDTARSCAPDVILVDAGMPRLNGAEFCRAYRDSSGVAALVLISAMANDVLTATTAACGAAACIPKPFEIVLVLETIAELVGGCCGRGAPATIEASRCDATHALLPVSAPGSTALPGA